MTNLGFAICINWIHDKIEKGKIPLKVFQPSPKDHEKHSEDPQCPHKVHIVNRIKSGKDAVKILGLEKSIHPQVHHNIPSVNAELKVVECKNFQQRMA